MRIAQGGFMSRSITLDYNRSFKDISRKLRKNMTEPEMLLWSRLRKKQILGIQFLRQKPLFNFIVDFYAHQCRLVVECDGSQHFDHEHQTNDIERDTILSSQGVFVLRFTNIEIINSLNDVVQNIWDVCSLRLSEV